MDRSTDMYELGDLKGIHDCIQGYSSGWGTERFWVPT